MSMQRYFSKETRAPLALLDTGDGYIPMIWDGQIMRTLINWVYDTPEKAKAAADAKIRNFRRGMLQHLYA